MSVAWTIAFGAFAGLSLLTALAVLGTLRRANVALEEVEARLRGTDSDPRPGGLPPGTSVPEFAALTDRGRVFTARELRGHDVVLLFLAADCPPCRALADELRAAGPPYVQARLVLVVDAEAEASQVIEGIDAEVVYQDKRVVSRAFNSVGTPHAFVIDRAGTVLANGMPNTLSALRELTASRDRKEVRRQEREAVST